MYRNRFLSNTELKPSILGFCLMKGFKVIKRSEQYKTVGSIVGSWKLESMFKSNIEHNEDNAYINII